MRKIILCAVCVLMFAAPVWSAEPLKVAELQKQQQEIARMNLRVDSEIAAYQVIIDFTLRQKIAREDLKQKLVDRFTELGNQIKAEEAVAAPSKPRPKQPKQDGK